MGRASQTLSFGANACRENLADVNPDDCALGNSEEGNVADEQPQEEALMAVCIEDPGNPKKTERGADGTDKKQSFAAELIDDGHAEKRGSQVHCPNGHGLQAAGHF